MTARHSIERLADDAPVPHADSWPARRPPSLAYDGVCSAFEAQAAKTAAWLATQHHDGLVSPAEKIVLDCLRALHALAGADRMYADTLTDVIARGFLETAWGVRNHKRRAFALLRIAGGTQ